MNNIFYDIINHIPARYLFEQKTLFINFVTKFCSDNSLKFKVDTNKKNRNIIIGNINESKHIITAHYDTPKLNKLPLNSSVTNDVFKSFAQNIKLYYSYLSSKNVANLHNFNDNTSGIACLLSIAASKPLKTAFVLFDNEENKLLGSSIFYKHNKKILESKLIINLDCIGCGEYTGIVYYTKYNRQYATSLAKYFKNGFSILPTNIFETDAKNFLRAVNISTFYKHKNIYKIKNLHSKYDNYIDLQNLDNIKICLLNYINAILRS